MTLEDLGYNERLEKSRKELSLEGFGIGRVVAEHKERYIVRTATAEFEAEITGNMRFIAKGREDFPAVGDWVALIDYDPEFAIIHKILPRYSVLERQAIGQFAEVQIIAANIDYAFLVQAVDRDFNINRLERYLTICHSSRVSPIIVLTKTDLIPEEQVNEIVESIKLRVNDVKILTISNVTQSGYEALTNCIEKGKSYCLLGSSGVGKSTLLNNLSGNAIMKTGSISMSTHKGRHVTSHRELFILDNGGILIDNPGMREVGITDAQDGLDVTFDRIVKLSQNCKFKDCRHVNEIGCSVLAALGNGEIDGSSYENYLKMLKEKIYFETTVEEKRKKEKLFGKILKDYKKGNYKNKF